jgi:uncharacterized hydrophobic protein (TIGR00271 family)
MIGLRLTVPVELVDRVVTYLAEAPGVAHVARLQGACVQPPGDLVLCDVVRESANEVIESLQDMGVHRQGSITVEAIDVAISDAAATAEAAAPGHGEDALVWEEVEAQARTGARLTVSFLAFMTIAAVIASVGILLDSPILIVGAMVVGPEYGPVAALCVAAARRRTRPVAGAAGSLGAGLALAALAALAATAAFRLFGLAPDGYDLSDRQLTAFISHPDGMAAVVAVLAGVAGMLSLTEGRAGALVGVLVSVTTIPAVANVGVATAYAEWTEVKGAALQLAVNLAGLLLAGVMTLLIQSRLTARRPGGMGGRSEGIQTPGTESGSNP